MTTSSTRARIGVETRRHGAHPHPSASRAFGSATTTRADPADGMSACQFGESSPALLVAGLALTGVAVVLGSASAASAGVLVLACRDDRLGGVSLRSSETDNVGGGTGRFSSAAKAPRCLPGEAAPARTGGARPADR